MGAVGNIDTDITSLTTDAGINIVDSLVEYHTDAVILCDGKFNVVKRNQRAAQVMLGRGIVSDCTNLFDILPEFDKESIRKQILSSQQDNAIKEFLCNVGAAAYSVKSAKMYGGVLIQLTEIARPSIDNDLDSSNFKMLFENMTSGFLFLKKTINSNGASDFEIIDINSTFEIYFEVERANIIGESLSRCMPEFSNTFAQKLERTATHGRATKEVFENPQTHRHLEVKIFSPRIGYADVMFNEIKAEIEQRNDLYIKNEISKAFALGGNSDVYKAIINILQHHTQSKCGFIGYPVDEHIIKVLAVNDKTTEYSLTNEDGEYVADLNLFPAGAEAVATKQQQTKDNVNGHACTLLTPILNNGTLVGLIGLADAPNGYDQKSKVFVLGLAEYAAPLMEREIKDFHYKKELIRAKEIAEQNERLKMSFLGNISHEIRTPLNSITGFSDLLMRSEDIPQRLKRWCEAIYKSSRQLLSIINSIVELSKLETNQAKIQNSTFSLNKLIDDVFDNYKSKADNKGLALIHYKDLDQYASTIYNDRQKIHQIMSTLVDNGLKFTDKGEVSFGYRYIKSNEIEFFVKDTGIGIRQEKQKDIFTPFQQIEPTLERNYGGVGIGLSICSRYIQMLGSRICLESEPGKGSLFHFAINYKTQPEEGV